MIRVKVLVNLALLCTFSLMLIACKKERNIEAIVIRDCTGVYLRIDSVDYKVCNSQKTENFSSGQTVEVTFEKIEECNNPSESGPVCMLYHPYESYVMLCKIE